MKREFDMLGDPIPEGRGKPGATGHILSVRNAQLAAISEVRGRTLLQLDKAAQGGSVSAMKEIGKIAKQAELECLASDIRKSNSSAKPLGVKAQRKEDAKPDGTWGFLGDAGPSKEVH